MNGPILDVYGMPKQSDFPACMTPTEVVEAAKIFGVRKFYSKTPNLMERLRRRAQERRVTLEILISGERLNLS